MEEKIKDKKYFLLNGSILKGILLFALPLFIGNLLQQFYSTVDTIIVGNFVSREAFDAIGSIDPIINTFIGFFTGLANGAGVVIAYHFGKKDDENLSKAVSTTIIITLFTAIILTAVSILTLPLMLKFMKVPDSVYQDAYDYLIIYFAGCIGLLFYNMGSGILRAVGDTKRPLYFLLFSTVLNIGLDLLFVIVFNLGVKGVAYATIISEFLSAVLVLIVLTFEKNSYRINWKNLRFDSSIFKRILHIGFPMAFQQTITAFSNVFVQSYINSFGEVVMGGWTAYHKLDKFVFLPMQTIGLSVSTFVSQNIGANQENRARQGTRIATIISSIICALLIALVLIFAPQLISIFIQDNEIINVGTQMINWMIPLYFTQAFNQVFVGALQGRGKTKISVSIMIGSFIVIRQIYLFVMNLFTFEESTHLFLTIFSYPMCWIICLIGLIIYYIYVIKHLNTKELNTK